MRRQRDKGITLIEALITMILLGLITMVTFSVLKWGFGQFRVAIDRQGLEADVRRMMTRLEKDLRQSNWDSLSFSTDVDRDTTARGSTVHRHGICLPTVSDWADPTNYDATNGLALPDRYVLYYATLDVPVGRFYRVEVDPGTPAVGPWGGLTAGFFTDTLPSGPSIANASVLAETVIDFTVLPRVADQVVEVSTRLFGRTRDAEGPRDEMLEIRLEAHPENLLQ